MRDRLRNLLNEAMDKKGIYLDEITDFLIKNNVVAFSCKVGDKVVVKATCECVQMIYDDDYYNGTGAVECPFENSCEYEDCDNGNERVFITTVRSIYHDSEGWKIIFDDLCVEADLKDEGISFFLGENAEEEAKKSLRGDCR